MFGTLHNEHNNDLKRSSSRFKVPPCLKTCTKANLPMKQPTIENWTENKTNSPLVKYNLDSLLSTQERYMFEHDQEVLKNFDFEKNLSDHENDVGKIVVKADYEKIWITGKVLMPVLTYLTLYHQDIKFRLLKNHHVQNLKTTNQP